MQPAPLNGDLKCEIHTFKSCCRQYVAPLQGELHNFVVILYLYRYADFAIMATN